MRQTLNMPSGYSASTPKYELQAVSIQKMYTIDISPTLSVKYYSPRQTISIQLTGDTNCNCYHLWTNHIFSIEGVKLLIWNSTRTHMTKAETDFIFFMEIYHS